ncbi:MAG: hypothetical protein ACOCSD_08240, partial [Halolamina sp.]
AAAGTEETTSSTSTDRIMEQVTTEGETAGSTTTGTDSTDPPDGDADDLAAEIEALRRAVEDQQAELERQSDLIDQLIQELRQGR